MRRLSCTNRSFTKLVNISCSEPDLCSLWLCSAGLAHHVANISAQAVACVPPTVGESTVPSNMKLGSLLSSSRVTNGRAANSPPAAIPPARACVAGRFLSRMICNVFMKLSSPVAACRSQNNVTISVRALWQWFSPKFYLRHVLFSGRSCRL